MDRKKLREIFFEMDICPWLPSLPVPGRKPRFGPYAKRALLHQLSSCIDAGMDLPRMLDLCLKERLPWRMKRGLRKTRQALEEGQSFSEALRRYAPRILPRSFYGIIEIAEQSGTLADTMKVLDDHYGNMQMIRRKIIITMLYPALLLCVGTCMAFFAAAKLLPTFAEIISDLGRKPPLLTQEFLKITAFSGSHLLLLVAGSAGVFLAFLLFLFLARRTALIGRIQLGIPFFGALVYHSHMLWFSRLMSILLEAGASVPDALALCGNGSMGAVLEKDIHDTLLAISEGQPLSGAFASRTCFSQTFLWFISIGEQRGNLTDSFSAITEFEQAKMQETIDLIPRFLPPAMVLIMSIVIGLLLLSIWLPVLTMSELLG